MDSSWLRPAAAGLEILPARAFIDPLRPVDLAIITHAHADHARPGHKQVIATAQTLAIMAARLGPDFAETKTVLDYGESLMLGDLRLGMAPAGHILGSAQIIMDYNDTRIIAAGDYKRAADPTCQPFQPVPCDIFITEATFGLPVFRQPDPLAEIARLLALRARFQGRAILVAAYALGKAQRLIALLRQAGWDETIYLHGAMLGPCRIYQEFGVDLGDLQLVTTDRKSLPADQLAGQFVLAPPSALGSSWARRLPDPVSCMASGWMQVRARARQSGIECPLVISDHADWPDLLATLDEVRPRQVWVTHGREDALLHACKQRGLDARALRLIGYGEDSA